MISKAKLRLLKSLQSKKIRQKRQLFIIQGAKAVQESFRSSYKVKYIFATRKYIDQNVLPGEDTVEIIEANPKELKNAGTLETNEHVLAVAEIQPNKPVSLAGGEYGLMLDDIRDPGNLGTILRIADWYGIKKIVASESSVDLYNPKVINASMGSFTRIDLFYTDLTDYLNNNDASLICADMQGESAHRFEFPESGFIVFGNESSGISSSILKKADFVISIPRFGQAESLNVAMATGIILDNLFRKTKNLNFSDN